MQFLPAGAPATLAAAFAYIGTVVRPTTDDLQLMLVLEATGKVMYEELADAATDAEVGVLLRDSGREELSHAYRLQVALRKLGVQCAVPSRAQNPYLPGWTRPPLTAALAEELMQAEFDGEQLYERWAAHCDHPEAAELLRLNGREEAEHGQRLRKVAALLVAAG